MIDTLKHAPSPLGTALQCAGTAKSMRPRISGLSGPHPESSPEGAGPLAAA